VHTQAGADLGGNVKDNQDAWCVQECLAGQDMAMFGVFDGHGQEGKVVSHSVCTNMPMALAKNAACKVGATAWGPKTNRLAGLVGEPRDAAGM
jgi:serine/threonine protein phosphatase PrpC